MQTYSSEKDFKHLVTRESANYAMAFSTRIPDVCGRRTVLARFIARDVFEGEDVILSIDATGIFESCENLFLFNQFRRSLGIDVTLEQAPYHFISASESDIREAFTALALYFYWDFSILAVNKKYVLRGTHDDDLELFCDEASLRDKFDYWRIGLSQSSDTSS